MWSPDGTELFFVSDQPEGLTSAFVSTEPSFSVDSTVLLYPPGNFILDNRHARYLTEDGQSFMLVRRDVAADGRRDLVLVEGLLHELRERIQD